MKRDISCKVIDKINMSVEMYDSLNLVPQRIAKRFMMKNHPEIEDWQWFIGYKHVWDDETCTTGRFIITIYEV